jgi:hypothetical protein
MLIRASTPAVNAINLPGLDGVVVPWSPREGTVLRAGAGAALSERTHPCDLVRAAMPTAHRRPPRPRRSRRFQHTLEETC